MRDVTHKIDTLRTAVARAELRAHPDTLRMIREGQVPKGDPLSVAKVAAVQAAKSTPAIIPYCHPVPLTFVGVEFELGERSITVTCTVKALYKTGVEMEALTAVAAAVLNLYDMLKMLDEEMEIVGVRLLSKTGGKSDFVLGVEGIHAAVLVVSDSVSQARSEDLSGARLVERLRELGLSVSGPDVVSDEAATIADWVRRTCDSGTARLVVLTGGTGIGPRDVTPEAVRPLLDRELAGVEDAFRAFGQERTPYAMFSRCVAGVRGNALVLCLPGSPTGVEDALCSLFPHVLHAIRVLDGAKHDVEPAGGASR